MSVLSVKRLDTGWTSAIDKDLVEKHTVVFQVVVDSRDDGPRTARLAPGVPSLYSAYSFGNDAAAGSLCINKTADFVTKQGTGYIWHVTCEYSNDADDSQSDPDPLARPYVIRGASADGSEALDVDAVDGRPIATATGEPYDPPLERSDPHAALIVERNVALPNLGLVDNALRNTNSDQVTLTDGKAVFVFQPRQLLLEDYSFTPQSESGADFYRETFTVLVRSKRWNPTEILHRGFKFLDADGVAHLATDEDERPLNEPILLAADGTKLPDGADPVFQKFNKFPETPYSLIF